MSGSRKTWTKVQDVQPEEAALSKPIGVADAPKDFDWVRVGIPCQAACPASTDVPGYLEAIARGNFDEAYRINLRDNIFPAALGRVCTRPCEPVCRHGREGLGDPVAICFSKRSSETFLAQRSPVVLEPWFEDTGKRIAVVGGGAAGLATARQLRLLGHAVTVLEQHEIAGGMMVQGIPPFRLPREIVAREVEQIRLTGVEIRCGIRVGRDIGLAALVADHDAVVISAGTSQARVPDLPGKDLSGIRHGLEFLLEYNGNREGEAACGDRVVVIGGGFTAVDCARAAKRTGSSSVRMCYRRSEKEMYITPGELDEMDEEGIAFESMVMPVAFEGEGGSLTGVRFARVRLGDPDESGRRRPEAMAGSEYRVPADTVLLGTGQTQDTSWIDRQLWEELAADGHTVPVRETHRTTVEKLFVAGDFATGAVSLVDAVGHAKSCARLVDRSLTGKDRLRDVVVIEPAEQTGRTREMDAIPRQPMPTLAPETRAGGGEVELGLDAEAARREASRCYLCNLKFEIDNDLCIYCDRCLKVKPVENCIVKVKDLKLGTDGRILGYQPSTSSRDYNLLYIDQDECIRCGACAEVCPVECIPLQRVDLCTVRARDI